MSTEYRELELALIEKHPSNPRHRAVADPELVESIKANGIIQPVIVAPIPDPDGKRIMERFILIAGHRRADGARKAKLKTVPAVIRDDLVTEGQQVEAMLIENGRREDLTPIEEAEGFAQLQLFGYKQKDIAKATGRDPKTVSQRLRLLKLAKSTQGRVHKGQMTLDDALAITEFSDDPAATKRLEEAASRGDFKYVLQRARQTKKAETEAAAAAADLRSRGVPEVTLPEGALYWDAFKSIAGTVTITSTPLRDPDEHGDCLTFAVAPGTQYDAARVVYGCTDPTSHDGQLSEDEKARRAADEKRRADSEAAAAAASAAQTVRIGTLLDALGTSTTMPLALRDLVRGLLPNAVATLDGDGLAAYQSAMKIPEEDQWTRLGGLADGPGARRNATLFASHVEDLDLISDNVLTRALVAVLVATAEDNLQAGDWRRRRDYAVRYLDLLEQLGHDFCDVDAEIRDSLTETAKQAS